MSLSANKSPKLLGNVIYQDTMTSNYLKEGKQDHHCDTHSNDKGTLRAFDQVFHLRRSYCKQPIRLSLSKPTHNCYITIRTFSKQKKYLEICHTTKWFMNHG